MDQLTKEWVLSALADGDVIRIIEGVVHLRLTYNPGGAFGIGQGVPGFFLAASVVIAVMLVVLAWRVEDRRWLAPLGLVLGGGLGNLIDRVVRDTGGRVIDFIDLQVWPVFNVADSAIVIGVAAMFWFSFRVSREQ